MWRYEDTEYYPQDLLRQLMILNKRGFDSHTLVKMYSVPSVIVLEGTQELADGVEGN